MTWVVTEGWSSRFLFSEIEGIVSATEVGHLDFGAPGESVKVVVHSCLTLFDPMDCSPPGSSVHGILQVRILEWVAIPFSGYLPNPGIKPRSPALQADSLLSEPPGKPVGVGGYLVGSQ